jgi:cold shock CspA family protein
VALTLAVGDTGRFRRERLNLCSARKGRVVDVETSLSSTGARFDGTTIIRTTLMNGIVKSYNPAVSFGFILYQTDEGENEIFVHRTNINAPKGQQVLRAGWFVTFEIGEFNGRPVALNATSVKSIEGSVNAAPAIGERTNDKL